MAYDHAAMAVGNVPYVDFGGTSLTEYRAFVWDHSAAVGTPVVAGNTPVCISGITGPGGKGGFLATPGAIVKLEMHGENLEGISAGAFYSFGPSGQPYASTQSATVIAAPCVRALEALGGQSGSWNIVKWFMIVRAH